MTTVTSTQANAPQPGDVVRVRTRTYLVESVDPTSGGHTVRMACLDDDAQGQPLETVWELELDREIVGDDTWRSIGNRGFDPPRLFAAYMNTLRWNCVTATDRNLFQSPFRAGIQIDPYQLEPLRKALRLPRVNLFIADDVGLGKTIEAGLIAIELLLRRRIQEIVVACPPSMLHQWKDELESRFGLTFEILDRNYIERVREERGYGVNPWKTFPRFLVSHRLLIDETYVAPLRDWLDNLRPGSLFILDEAHHAAPSSGAKYAIDSKITRAIRDLAPRFEHRLFLSATPHNGHSNSFSALLEILDPQRFCRGVKVVKSNLDDAMVRRLKEDIGKIAGGFPTRHVVQIDLKGLSEDAPELALARLLNSYRDMRARRMEGQSKRKQAEAGLLITGLQQRLLSSVEAFAKTLRVHRRSMEKLWKQNAQKATETEQEAGRSPDPELLTGGVGADDDRAQLTEAELDVLADAEVETSTEATGGNPKLADSQAEKDLLDEMGAIAEQWRGQPDEKLKHLIQWIQEHMCPGVRLPGQPIQGDTNWEPTRIILFTEYEDTKRYILNVLRPAIAGTGQAEQRIEVFHGPTPPDKREQIKRAFNMPPDQHPVRILIATDAAREGLNLQAHCHNLFHFDVPWNPSRLEQRNGRIDRKLQPAPDVYCHYFVYTQRPEDRVLQALVRKTKTIREELGSLSQVLETRLAETMSQGIRQDQAVSMAKTIEDTGLDPDKQETVKEELDATRERETELEEQIALLKRRVEDARKWIGLDTESFRDALSCALELLGAEPLSAATKDSNGQPRQYEFPRLDTRQGGDPTWSSTLDTLRALPEEGKKDFRWRKEAPIRPIVFESPKGVDDSVVQLHLQHRVTQRLLGRFMAQGFVHHDLSRACIAQSDDNIPRVVLLGRVSLYGPGASRLHEEILSVTARWTPPDQRKDGLNPYARDAESRTLELLSKALKPGAQQTLPEATSGPLLDSLAQDIETLLPHLQGRGDEAMKQAEERLTERGEAESKEMRRILEEQKKRILAELNKSVESQLRLFANDDEKRTYESNRRYWDRWIKNVDDDLDREPARILDFYRVHSCRIEPTGIVYLFPASS